MPAMPEAGFVMVETEFVFGRLKLPSILRRVPSTFTDFCVVVFWRPCCKVCDIPIGAVRWISRPRAHNPDMEQSSGGLESPFGFKLLVMRRVMKGDEADWPKSGLPV